MKTPGGSTTRATLLLIIMAFLAGVLVTLSAQHFLGSDRAVPLVVDASDPDVLMPGISPEEIPASTAARWRISSAAGIIPRASNRAATMKRANWSIPTRFSVTAIRARSPEARRHDQPQRPPRLVALHRRRPWR